jgi:hypothetical protein
MFNILALGFYCQIYKKKPNIRIFINNIFIDEFDIEPYDFENNSVPNLKFYQLNLPNNFKEYSIKLNIKNSDSNYNNGFMTKSTLIKFHTCCLVPCNDYQYVLNKINSKNSIKFEEPDMAAFNLIPHLFWKDEQNNFLENILHLTIGGSGVFTCDLIRHINILKPKSIFPTSLSTKIA